MPQQLAAEREPVGLGLRVVEAELSLEDVEVGLHPSQRIGEAARADRRLAVEHLAEAAVAHDVGEELLARRAGRAEQVGLVVVGRRGEVGVARREVELRLVLLQRVVLAMRKVRSW